MTFMATHIQGNPEQSRVNQTKCVRNYLPLMELIAWMLVSGAKGDCSAVSINMPTAQIRKCRIYHANNRPCSQIDHKFIIKVKELMAGLQGLIGVSGRGRKIIVLAQNRIYELPKTP